MLTSAFNQCVNPWAIDAIGWWYYIVYCGWLIIELVFVVAFIVETKGTMSDPRSMAILLIYSVGRTLEETAALFDGDEQPQDLANMGGEAATLTMNRGLALQLQERPSSHSDDRDHKHDIFESSQPMLRVTVERSMCTDSEVGRAI